MKNMIKKDKIIKKEKIIKEIVIIKDNSYDKIKYIL